MTNIDHFLFKASIDAFNNHFTGLMIVKPLTEEDYRIIFINELGIKIFDLEIFGTGDHKVHYCIEYLDKKLIIKTLKNDLSLMLNNQKSRILGEMQNKKSGIRVYKTRDKKGIKYLVVNDTTARVERIVRKDGLSKSANTSFFSSNGVELDSVRIAHKNIKLDIHLSKINENK